jgi:hypothetical protein
MIIPKSVTVKILNSNIYAKMQISLVEISLSFLRSFDVIGFRNFICMQRDLI